MGVDQGEPRRRVRRPRANDEDLPGLTRIAYMIGTNEPGRGSGCGHSSCWIRKASSRRSSIAVSTSRSRGPSGPEGRPPFEWINNSQVLSRTSSPRRTQDRTLPNVTMPEDRGYRHRGHHGVLPRVASADVQRRPAGRRSPDQQADPQRAGRARSRQARAHGQQATGVRSNQPRVADDRDHGRHHGALRGSASFMDVRVSASGRHVAYSLRSPGAALAGEIFAVFRSGDKPIRIAQGDSGPTWPMAWIQ